MNQIELSHAFRSGEISTEDFVTRLRSHFEAREPFLHAFLPEVDRFERLQKEAKALTDRFPDPRHRPILFGTLVGVKDIFHAAGFVTQAGSRLPAQELQGTEAESVTRLKNAGALVLGKTVTTEFAYFTPGPTRNPHNPEHTPGGSSSGSAAAIGAGLCSLALGTQTIGSLIRPAAFCGTVALKPTYERISRSGVIPLSPSFDHVGFFVPEMRMVDEVASVLYRDWQEAMTRKGPVLGIPEGAYLACASNAALACFNAVCGSLADAGYELRRIPVMADYQEIRNRHDIILSFDAAKTHGTWFAKYESLYSSKLSDLIQRGQKVTLFQYQDACLARDQFRDQMTKVMDENEIDLWICPPAVGPAPKGLESTGDPVMCLPWTQIGFPAVNLPLGKSDEGLPMGLQVVGKWYTDEALVSWSTLLEKTVSDL